MIAITRTGMMKKASKTLKPYTKEEFEKVLECLNNSIGVSGDILIRFIAYCINNSKDKSRRNKRSDEKLIKWLISAARPYADFGTYNPFINSLCKHWCKCNIETDKEEK